MGSKSNLFYSKISFDVKDHLLPSAWAEAVEEGVVEMLAHGSVEAAAQQDALLTSDGGQDAARGRPGDRKWRNRLPGSADGVENVDVVSLGNSGVAATCRKATPVIYAWFFS